MHDIRVRAYALDGSHTDEIRRVRVLAADDDDRLRITQPAEGAQILKQVGPDGMVFRVGGVAGRWDQLAEVTVQGATTDGWSFDGAISPGGLRDSLSVRLTHDAPWSVQATAKTQQGGMRYSQKVGFEIYGRSIDIWNPNSFGMVPTPGRPWTMSADAKDCTGCIAAVEFLSGETVLARVNARPYNFNLASLPVGTYSITARMLPVDASRGTLTSAAVSVTVVANAVPTVALTSPAAGAVMDPYQTVTLAATASDADGTVAKVDFYNGEQLLASRTTAPYTYTWPLGAAGEYVFSARATDNQGAVGTSAAVRLRVGADPVDPNPRETITYIHPDVSGSPLVATNANGNVVWKENYQAYGQRLLRQPGSEGQGQWFHGKEADAGTGLQYFGARYYDPVVGRFMGVDPVGFQEDNLHSFNRYAYGNNNPVRYLDPDGNSPLDVGFLLWDVGKLGLALYSGNGAMIGEAAADVFISTVGVLSPVPGTGLAIKAGRAADKASDVVRAAKGISGETKFTSAGRRAHAQEPLPPGFEREVTIPGTKLRMDGYNRKTKQILEIKPDNARAVKRGESQLEKYCAACDKSELGSGHSTVPVQTYDPSKYV